MAQIHAARGKIHCFRGFRDSVIRLGIVGTNYGRTVQLPAFRAGQPLRGGGAGRQRRRARGRAGARGRRAKGYGDWRALVEDKTVDAVAIATMPALQARIAIARARARQAGVRRKADGERRSPTRAPCCGGEERGQAGDARFQFPQIMAWQRAKAMLDDGAVGRLRHVAVHWQVENRAIQMRMRNWKTLTATTAAACSAISSRTVSIISNGSAGRLPALSARALRLAGRRRACRPPRRWRWVCRRAAGQPVDELRVLSRLGAPLEFYGEDGTLVLHNPGADYMRGFELFHAKRGAAALARIAVEDPADAG